MTEITYDRGRHRLTVTGHAGYDKYGQDIVCAAVSALTCTLAAYAARLRDRGGEPIPANVTLSHGSALIICQPDPDSEECVTQVFDALCAGFGLLAESYPDCVKYSCI